MTYLGQFGVLYIYIYIYIMFIITKIHIFTYQIHKLIMNSIFLSISFSILLLGLRFQISLHIHKPPSMLSQTKFSECYITWLFSYIFTSALCQMHFSFSYTTSVTYMKIYVVNCLQTLFQHTIPNFQRNHHTGNFHLNPNLHINYITSE